MLKPFATKLDEEVLKRLDALAQKTQIPKARLCRQAIDMLADYYEDREKKIALIEGYSENTSGLVASGASKDSIEKKF